MSAPVPPPPAADQKPKVHMRPMTTAERARAARLGFICGWRKGLPARCAQPPDTAVTDRYDGRLPVDGEVGSSGTWTELCDTHAYAWGMNRIGDRSSSVYLDTVIRRG